MERFIKCPKTFPKPLREVSGKLIIRGSTGFSDLVSHLAEVTKRSFRTACTGQLKSYMLLIGKEIGIQLCLSPQR